ncbi:MAG: DUF3109 family protein [Bacteroidota bacterium]
MFIIGEAIIDDAVGHVSFCCDLHQCKGACCCIEGGRGAPLEDDEVLEIEKAYPIIKGYLSERSISVIEATGMYEGTPGDFVTPCVEERDCVYVHYDADGIARCSFERAFTENLIDWRKPLSCHLFPIRVRRFGKDYIRYEQIEECEGGRQFGEKNNIKLSDFLKDALTRKYGETWYNNFKAHCDTLQRK